MNASKLESIWEDKSNTLPFNPNVNEQLVFECIQKMHAANEITAPIKERIQQWVKFNKGFNEHEDDEYILWVRQLYSNIENLLNT